MFSRIVRATAVALAATQLASAQTFTECNPMEKTCPDDPALGKTVTVDFTKGKNDVFQNADGTTISYDGGKGAVFTINKETDAPTILSNDYIFFGKVTVTLQAATGTGVVTSFVLQSDDLDEIDWEWLGGDTAQVQSNYFGKGDTTTYDRGAYHPVAAPQTQFHTYTIDWTKDYVKWYIDGSLVRTLNYNDAKGGTRFPQTPMQIKLGTWDAGRKDAPKGTVEWAGGYTNFDEAPFIAYYKSITIQDYSNGVSGAKKYSWSDKSGSYQSIKVITGNGGDDSKPTTTSSTTTPKGHTSTKSGLTTMTSSSSASKTGDSAPKTSDGIGFTGNGGTTTASPTTTSTSASASATNSPGTNGAGSAGINIVVMVAALFLGFLVL